MSIKRGNLFFVLLNYCISRSVETAFKLDFNDDAVKIII